jgi:hypothetical protein
MLFKLPNGHYAYKELSDWRSHPEGREGPKIQKIIV